MATVRSTAKTQSTNKSPQSPTAPSSTVVVAAAQTTATLNDGGGQEDIASIAKQISDHAEAIYQTWKARGLAPTEILNCHTTTTNDFGKSLTKSQSNNKSNTNRKSSSPTKNTVDGHRNFSNKDNSPVTELLVNTPDMSNNNLEKLVNTFVNEDKARLAARKRNSGSPTTTTSTNTGSSTIQHALKKFDKSDVSPTKQTSPTPASPSSSSSLLSPSSSSANNTIDQVLPKNNDLTKISVRNSSNSSSSNKISSTNNTSTTKNTTNPSNPQSSSQQQSQTPSAAIQQHQQQQKPQTPAKPANLINHVPTWPLKNRLGSPVSTSPTSSTVSPPSTNTTTSTSSSTNNSVSRNKSNVSPTKDILDSPSTTSTTITNHTTPSTNPKTTVKTSSSSKTSGRRKSAELLDEVSREEERLINALKAGQILNSDGGTKKGGTLPDVVDGESNGTSWKKPDVSTTTASPNTVTATWNGIQLKPISVTGGNALAHQKIDEIRNNNNVLIGGGGGTGSGTYVKMTKPRAPRTENVPHPELSSSRNHGIRQTASSPVRPFLTRGSVAERVLIFERCPEVGKVPPRNAAKEQSKLQQVNYFHH